MKASDYVSKQLIWTPTIVIAAAISVLSWAGCASSEESTDWEKVPPPAPAMAEQLQKSIDSLKGENANLKNQVGKLENEKRTLAARNAELEMKLSESAVKEKPPVTTMTNPKAEYDRGLGMFRQRNYQDAASTFMGLLNAGAPEDLESNCHYWIGESFYGMKQYNDALTHFGHVASYKRTTKKDDAQIMIANCYYMLGDKTRAKQEYQKLIDQYPASPYVKRAKARLGQK